MGKCLVQCSTCPWHYDNTDCDFYKVLYSEKYGKGHGWNSWSYQDNEQEEK